MGALKASPPAWPPPEQLDSPQFRWRLRAAQRLAAAPAVQLPRSPAKSLDLPLAPQGVSDTLSKPPEMVSRNMTLGERRRRPY